MQQYYPLLQSTTLFSGVSAPELDELMLCFAPKLRRFEKDEFVLHSGYENRDVGILLEGRLEAFKNTPDGGSVAITRMEPGAVFGDVLSGSTIKSPVSISARTPSTVVFLPYEKIIHPCSRMHVSHSLLLQNLVQTISDKYFALNSRVDLLILKSLRAKLCAWLLEQSRRAGSDTFAVEMSRAALAEYLNCERSALSRELGRMQHEGLLETYRGSFKLLDRAKIEQQYEGGLL